MDTINRLKKEIVAIKDASANSIQTTASLRDSVSSLQSQLDIEQKKTDSISFLGMDFSKGGYHAFVWVVIIVLALAFIATLFAFRKSKVDTVEHKKTAEELQNELQAFKKKTLEKEQQLKRQLLDEQLKRNS